MMLSHVDASLPLLHFPPVSTFAHPARTQDENADLRRQVGESRAQQLERALAAAREQLEDVRRVNAGEQSAQCKAAGSGGWQTRFTALMCRLQAQGMPWAQLIRTQPAHVAPNPTLTHLMLLMPPLRRPGAARLQPRPAGRGVCGAGAAVQAGAGAAQCAGGAALSAAA